tara:strand:- start:453 stop:602 length:150 start_codon:yes stop_codon:yes gene_type:complete
MSKIEKIIQKSLEKIKDTQINLNSAAARKAVAAIILEDLKESARRRSMK